MRHRYAIRFGVLVAITAILSALCLTPGVAGSNSAEVRDLSPWNGEFISRSTLIQHPDMQPLYRQIASEAKAIQKDYSVENVKAHFAGIFHTEFQRVDIKGNTIKFHYTDSAAKPVSKTYRYIGEVSDTFQKHKFKWHGFAATDESPDVRYSSLLMMAIHKHGEGEPHFHMRYASGLPETATGPKFEQWWPTLIPADVDIISFRNGLDAKMLATLLP